MCVCVWVSGYECFGSGVVVWVCVYFTSPSVIVPDDKMRVQLVAIDGEPGTDYINASWMTVGQFSS